jgi:acylphosphatase
MADVPGELPDAEGRHVRLTARVSGRVQGVGFRDYVRSRARRLGLVGSATNLADGRVEVVAEGSEQSCRILLEMLVTGHTPGWTASVDHVWSVASDDLQGFARR